jgi:hypothetical protein
MFGFSNRAHLGFMHAPFHAFISVIACIDGTGLALNLGMDHILATKLRLPLRYFRAPVL